MKKKSPFQREIALAIKNIKVNPNMVTHENDPFVQRKLAAAKKSVENAKFPPEFKTGK